MARIGDGFQVPTLSLVVAPGATRLERFAADELRFMLERIFDVRAVISSQIDDTAEAVIAIGRPGAHALIAELSKDSWPALSNQGLLLRTLHSRKPTLLAGGGSDVATLWAVYELAERLGVRYLHDRDVYPARRSWPGLPQLDLIMEPNLSIRCWRLLNEAPHGPISWNLDENLRFIRQMAKMKFNRIRFEIWPAQPFIQYSIRGVAKPGGVIHFGEDYPIDDDTLGLEKFGPIEAFTNPEFLGAQTSDELHRRAVRLLKTMLAEARRLGMETALAFNPAEWPREFQQVLPGTEPITQVGHLTIGPGADQSIDDPLLRDATATVIKACVQTYPDVDYLILSMPEHGHWTGHAREAYDKLVSTYNVRNIDSFEQLCAQARHRTDFPGGPERVERQLKNDLSSLWFLDSVVREHQLLKRPAGGADFKLMYDSITEELFGLVSQVAPPGGEIVSFLDYTASRQLARRDLLEHVPPPHVPASLIFTLADDNVGILPQLANQSLHTLMGLLRNHKWSGFNTRFWTIGDLDPTIHLLARGSWDASFDVADAYADQVCHVCGPDAVKPASAAFAIIEDTTRDLDQYGMGFGFLVPGMMIHHFEAGELRDEFIRDRQRFARAAELMQQALNASREQGRQYLSYFLNRLHFAVRYLDAAEAFSKAGQSFSRGDLRSAVDHADQAHDSIRQALRAYADVARDHGDMGAIAAMNKYCHRVIRDKCAELKAMRDRRIELHVRVIPKARSNVTT